MTRALVVGAGSIGTRHAGILGDLGLEVAFVTRRTDIAATSFDELEAGLAGFTPDYVVVANETARHASTVQHLAGLGFHGKLLVEKPLAASLAESDWSSFAVYGVAYNLRFHPLITALAAAVAGSTVLTAEVYAGQHLSTWRPGRDAGEQYSGSAERGGGVLRDLAHEFDYLAALLGECTGVFARGGRLGDVTVDSDDAWGIVASYTRAPLVTIQLNYLDTQIRRRVVLNTGTSTIEADFRESTLRVNDRTEHFPVERNDSYTAMHRAMLDADGQGVTTFPEASRTDALIATVERSASEQEWLSL